MNNDNQLITISQNAKLLLIKSKNLLNITKKILDKKDEDWIETIFKWADEYELSEDILPRNKLNLKNLKSLEFSFLTDCNHKKGYLPKEIGNLIHLEKLNLHDIVELPDSIINLKELKSLSLIWYECGRHGKNDVLISKWIKELQNNGCDVFEDCDYH